jgi:hypothetical protein
MNTYESETAFPRHFVLPPIESLALGAMIKPRMAQMRTDKVDIVPPQSESLNPFFV